MSTMAYVALGSNEGDRHDHLRRAVEAMAELPDVQVVRRSSLYETAPWRRGLVRRPARLGGAHEPLSGESIRVAGNVVAPVEGERRVPGLIEVFAIEFEYFHRAANLNKAVFGTRQHYPGTLNQPFTSSFDDLTKEIQSVYPGFKGFEENVAGVPGGTAWFNPRTQKIEFGIPFNQTTRGLVAEETRHALDFAQGVDLSATMAAFKAETGLEAARNVNQFSLWHHRRVYTRMLQDADRGHPVMGRIIGKGDIPSIYDMYISSDACGSSALDWLLQQSFTNPFHSAP